MSAHFAESDLPDAVFVADYNHLLLVSHSGGLDCFATFRARIIIGTVFICFLDYSCLVLVLTELGVLRVRVRVRLLLDKLLLFVHNWLICMHI